MYRYLKAIYRGERHQKLAFWYEVFMAFMIILAISITISSFIQGPELLMQPNIIKLDILCIILFNLDYWGGMLLCDDKKVYFKHNLFDLVSLIPLNQAFLLFRGVKLFRLLKLLQLVRVVGSFLSILDEIKMFLKDNGFMYLVGFTLTTISLGAIAIYFAERGKTIENFYDAIWWTIVTTTTVGYGDISPQTGIGRIIAVILMFVGIGFIGMMTGSITTYFTQKVIVSNGQQPVENLSHLDCEIDDLNGETIDLSDLTVEQYAQVIQFIKFLKSTNQ